MMRSWLLIFILQASAERPSRRHGFSLEVPDAYDAYDAYDAVAREAPKRRSALLETWQRSWHRRHHAYARMKGNDSPNGRKDDRCIPIPGAGVKTKTTGSIETCADGHGIGCKRGCKYLVENDSCGDCKGHHEHQPTPEEQIEEYQKEHGRYRIPKAMDSFSRHWRSLTKYCQTEIAGECSDRKGHCCCKQGRIFKFSSRECVKEEKPPVEKTPVEPVETPVVEAAPTQEEKPQGEKTPVEKTPVEPVETPVVEAAPTQEEKPPVEKTPVEPVETPVVEAAPTQEDLEEDGADLEAPEKWSSCEKHNAHKCFVGKCCCNVGTDYKRGGCVKSGEGDKDPRVIEHQIPNSRKKHNKFHGCLMTRNMHPCGTGCCCNRALEYVVETGKCEDSPSKTGPKAGEKSVMDPAPPKEDPIPGSQFWTSSGGTCEAKEAYGCGPSSSHCCCRFGCEFQEIYDKCGSCKDEAQKVQVNMIPASQLWVSRVKRGICNARGSHPCGPGCCCNAGFTWSKENRRCEQSNPTLPDGPLEAGATTNVGYSPTPSPPGSASTGASQKPKNGSIRAGHLAMSLLLLPLVWIRSSC